MFGAWLHLFQLYSLAFYGGIPSRLLLTNILSRKRLAAFSAAFLILLSAANLTFGLVVGSTRTLDLVLRGGESDSVLLIERSARTIYTSHIPASLAISLGRLPSVEAEPFIATVGYVAGSVMITQGLQSTSPFAKALLSGYLPSGDGPWAIMGERAAERLGTRAGETIQLASSLRKTVLLLTVAAVCRFGDMRDDEMFVHERTAKMLSGLPEGMISAVVVRGISRESVETLLSRTYRLKIRCSSAVPGNLVVLEANGALIRSVKFVGKVEEDLDLPFGYYTVAFQSPHLTMSLASVLLDADKSCEGSVELEASPILKVLGSAKPMLRGSDGVEIQAIKQDESWIFRASPGVYRLELSGQAFTIPLFHSATFNPSLVIAPTRSVRVLVSWSDGTEARDYNLIAKTMGGEVVLSRLGLGGETKIDLPNGDYVVEVYRLPYSASAIISIPGADEMRLILPSIQWNVEKVPLQYYTLIRALPVEEMASFTFASIAGVSAALLTALSLSMMALFIMLIANIQNYLYLSARGRLQLIGLLGASRQWILQTVGFPALILNLGLAVIAAAISSVLGSAILLNRLTVLGHSIIADAKTVYFFSLVLAASAWFLGNVKLLKTMNQV